MDGNGDLEKPEVKQLFIKLQGNNEKFDEIFFNKTFQVMDKSGDGKLDVKELQNYFIKMAEQNYWLIIEDPASSSPFGGRKITQKELYQIVYAIFTSLD